MTQDARLFADTLFRLLSSSALGDKRAFAELYTLTSPKLFGVCYKIMGRNDLAEEALQDAFINIWHHAQNYRPDKAAVMTWMVTIVRNKCFDILRNRPQELDLKDDVFYKQWASDDLGPFEKTAEKSDVRALLSCMKTLSPTQRQAIALSYFHGMAHEQLANHLAQPLGSIKTWVRRGLIALKSCLSGARS